MHMYDYQGFMTDLEDSSTIEISHSVNWVQDDSTQQCRSRAGRAGLKAHLTQMVMRRQGRWYLSWILRLNGEKGKVHSMQRESHVQTSRDR